MNNVNLEWANVVAEELYRSGVRTICISPGSRSTPLVLAFAKLRKIVADLQVLVHIDERSAGFFALGLAKVSKKPVVLLCTSGTAAANYYPAIIEAFYSSVPIVILTADRPPELRDCGAGQTIDQIQMYGNHLRYFFEVGTPEISEFKLKYLRSLIGYAVGIATDNDLAGPVHLNFAFADPLVPETLDEILAPEQLESEIFKPEILKPETLIFSQSQDFQPNNQPHYQVISGKKILSVNAIKNLATQIKNSPCGIIVVGVYDAEPEFAAAVKALAEVTGYPLLAEAAGMNRQGTISHYDSFLRATQVLPTPDLIIRFGVMPTSKSFLLWQNNSAGKNIEKIPEKISGNISEKNTEQIIIGNGKNTDPTHNLVQNINADAISFCNDLTNYFRENNLENQDQIQDENQDQKLISTKLNWRQSFEKIELITKNAKTKFLDGIDCLFDGKVFSELGKWLPENTLLYVANSTAIRDLDSFFHSENQIKILVNRGANGIDGTLSSALGAAFGSDLPVVLICGDLAFYHDLNGLMAVKKYGIKLTVILLNNDGGGIFEMMPISIFKPIFEEFFGTAHGLDFAPIVRAYDGDFIQIKNYQHLQECVLNSLQTAGTQVLEVKTNRQQNQQLHQQFWEFIRAQILADFEI